MRPGLGLDVAERAYLGYYNAADDGLPSFWLDLGIVGSYISLFIRNSLAPAAVFVWLFILYTKAVMVTCGFGGGKSLAIMAISILAYYPAGMAIGILSQVLHEITM